MKKLFAILFLLSLAYADFQLQNLDVAIKLNEDGSAAVEERINVIVFGQYSMQLYESGYNKNNLASWQDVTNISEIKTHIGANYADTRNIVVRPQPLQKSKSGLDVWYGQIIVDYSAYPYYDKNGSVANRTGLVIMDNYKPRTTRYTLNENAFSFKRTETGDIKLDDTTTLSITPPSNALITIVNPITEDMSNVKFPAPSRTLKWSGLTLVQFSLVYEIEQSLDKEVLSFFSDLQQSIRASLSSPEGLSAIAVVLVLAAAYFYLRLSRR